MLEIERPFCCEPEGMIDIEAIVYDTENVSFGIKKCKVTDQHPIKSSWVAHKHAFWKADLAIIGYC